MNFKTYLPMILQQGEHAQTLGFQTALANAHSLIMRGVNGQWAGLTTLFNLPVIALAAAPDGSIYIGGRFTDMTDANGDYITRWNGTAFNSLGTGMNSRVNALAVGPDGAIYAGGQFSLAGGVANTVGIAKWDGSAWVALGTGCTAGSKVVYALAFGPDGSLYAGGDFTTMGGVANTAYIAKWDGANWTALSTGAGGIVRAITAGKDGSIYIGGDFTNLTDANGDYISKWNGSAFVSLSTGANGVIRTLATAMDGAIFAGGDFTTIGGISCARIAKWNGVTFFPLGSGCGGGIYSLYVDTGGFLYVGGNFNAIGGIATPGGYAIWTGTSWLPFDVNNNAYANAFAVDKLGNLYIGGDFTGTSTAATVTASTAGNAAAYPVITFTGPGTTYQLKNYTTGKAIYFNLTLLAGETAVLNLDPLHTSFVSSFRGNIINTILPGSNLNWELLPGANNVSSFMYGSTTAASAIVMTWRDGYLDMWNAVR